MFNYKDNEEHLDLTDPWYKNSVLVSLISFVVLLMFGIIGIAMLPF